MERWAANTLRTLGIIFTAGVTLIASIILLLFAACATTSNSSKGIPFVFAAMVVMVAGVWLTVWLARGITRSSAAASSIPPNTSTPAELSVHQQPIPISHGATDSLILAVGVQIAVSFLCWLLAQRRVQMASSSLTSRRWLVMLIFFALYHLPYAILFFSLLRKPIGRTFVYALVVPAIFVLSTLYSVGFSRYFFMQLGAGLLLFFLPWSLHIFILVLAWRAIRQQGIRPEPSSLLVAALATSCYVFVLSRITLLSRFFS